ncbi:MAG TPA: UDP-N-acetylglucosamine 2-epimerase [Candidatus Binatia bacterium]
MELKGKKAFCFIALKHHGRFLFPVTRALEERGMQVLYPTAQAESPFEITMLDEGLSYNHAFSYLTPDLAAEIEGHYREIKGIWRERFMESSLLHYFPLSIQDKALRMHVENFYLFRRMFEVERPDVVLAPHELNSWGKILGYLCHEFRVPFITFQEGLYWGPTGVYRYHTEYSTACLAWGESARQVLVGSGSAAEKIYLVGNTHLSPVVEELNQPAAIAEVRRELKLKEKNRVFTILMGGLGYPRDWRFPQPLLDWIRGQKDLTVIFKWHPFNSKQIIDEIVARIQSVPNTLSLQQYDTYKILAASDLCAVFGNTTTGLEALAFGKPLIEVKVEGQRYSFAALGVADPVAGLAELPAAAEAMLKNGVPPGRKKKVEEYLIHNLHYLDGKSTERTVGLIEQALENRAGQDERLSSARSFGQKKIEAGAVEFDASIILPFNSAEGVAETLGAIAAHTSGSYECLLASGAAPEENRRLEEFAGGDLRLIARPGQSIPALANLAAEQAKGRYLCFLLPGMVSRPGWLEALVAAAENEPDAGVVGGKIVYADGLLAHAGVALDVNFNPAPLYHLLPAAFPGSNRAREMRAVAGCLLIPRAFFLALNGFDEGYAAALYDIDFCFRAGAAGRKTLYTPEALFYRLIPDAEPAQSDRLRLHAQWIGSLWPDVQKYWREDGLDHKALTELYRQTLPQETKVSPLPAD